MYTMRPAQSADRPQIRELVTARSQWLFNRGVIALPNPAVSRSLAGERDTDGRPLVWVCHDEDDVLRGVASLLSVMPDGTWRGDEMKEHALLLTGTWTDPLARSDRLGALMAWWALDYAAKQGVTWLRRLTSSSRLLEYHQQQGWTFQRTAHSGRAPQHLLTRRALPVPGLRALITESADAPVLSG